MHFQPALLWNPINVVEGEGGWVFFTLSLLCASWVVTKMAALFVTRLQKRRPSSHIGLALSAFVHPFTVLVWFIALLFSLDKVTERWLSENQAFFFALMKCGAALSFGWFLFRYKKLFVAAAIEKKKEEDPEIAEVLRAASKMGSVFIVIVILFLIHDVTGISMTTVLAFGGVGGLALAFASQEIVQNFFGGFMLHMTRPFFHGELISIPQNNIEGTVERIGWYQTTVRSSQRESMYVPNSVFTRACVVNKTRMKGRLFEPTFIVEMPSAAQFQEFCSAVEARLHQVSGISTNERISVWLKKLYGKKAEVALSCVTHHMPLHSFCSLQTRILLLAQGEAERLGGTLSIVPSQNEALY